MWDRKETQIYRTLLWSLWEKARVGWSERIALKHVYYNMWKRSPVQVWCMRQGAQGWYTGMAQRDGMGRGVGGGFRMGTHVHPWLIHINVWQKPLQYCKVISLQLKKKKRILEWVAIPFLRESSSSSDQTWVSCIAGGSFPSEPPGKPNFFQTPS